MHTLLYCFDAYCGWCYGFSPVIRRLAETYNDSFHIEVLSGGMILPETPRHISVTAPYIREAYPEVESRTGIKFGESYLWHIENPDLSDWFPHSEKPAIALGIFKEMLPERQVECAADIQYALHYEGRDLCDDESYRHLLEKYQVKPGIFYELLHSQTYREKAYYEFALCKQLQVTGYPTVFMQSGNRNFYLLSRGFTEYGTLTERLEILKEKLQQREQES